MDVTYVTDSTPQQPKPSLGFVISDVARLIAPRPALYAFPEMLSTTHAAYVWFDKMRPSYEQFRCPDRTNFVEMVDGARFYRVITRNWFNRWLEEEVDTSVLLWAPGE